MGSNEQPKILLSDYGMTVEENTQLDQLIQTTQKRDENAFGGDQT